MHACSSGSHQTATPLVAALSPITVFHPPAAAAPWRPLLLLSPLAMQSAVARSKPLPVVSRVSKDSSTGLYLISVRNYVRDPLVLDLAGSLLWWSCVWGEAQEHPIPCSSGTCRVANRNHPPNCPYVDGGRPGSSEPGCNCTAYPYNPVNGKCGSGGLTWEWLSANATDGRRPLYPVSFRAVASCAPDDLPTSSFAEIIEYRAMGRYGEQVVWRHSYPGVAGLSRSPLSLPSQVAAGLKVSSKFALCLPHVAIFGGGPVHIPAADDDVETVTDHLSRTRLVRNPRNSAYYIDVAGIAVNGARVALPDGALALSSEGQGGVALSTVTPYTALRPDIYRAVLAAFDAVTADLPRAVDVPKPMERCFNLTVMNQLGTWTGALPVAVDLMLSDGKNWTFTSLSATHEVVPQTLCFAFVEMGAGTAAAYAVPDSPAVVVGGHQMENNLLEFDLKKGVLGYTGLMSDNRMASCSGFNFENGLGR